MMMMRIVKKISENVGPRAKTSSATFTTKEILPAKPCFFFYTRGNANRSSCPFHVVLMYIPCT